MKLVFLVSALVCLSFWVAPTQSSDASDGLEAAQTVVDVTSDMAEAANDLLNPKTTKTIVKAVSGLLDGLSAVLGPLSSVLSLFLAFIPTGDSEELAYMKDAFGRVEGALSGLDQKMSQLSHQIDWQTVQLSFGDEELAIYLTHDDMMETLAAYASGKPQADLDYYRDNFARSYDKRDIMGSLDTLYIAITNCGDLAFCDEPILDAYERHTGCNRKEMANFINKLTNIISKGQQVVLAYLEWDEDSGSSGYAKDFIEEWKEKNKDLEAKFSEKLSHCIDDFKEFAKKDVEDKLDSERDMSQQDMADSLKKSLSEKYDWLEWTVVSHYSYDDSWNYGHTACDNSDRVFDVDMHDRHVVVAARDPTATPQSDKMSQVKDILTAKINYIVDGGRAGTACKTSSTTAANQVNDDLKSIGIYCGLVSFIRDWDDDRAGISLGPTTAISEKRWKGTLLCKKYDFVGTVLLL